MEAIVLARRDIRESDQVVSFYSREQGRVDLMARGIKKMVSKNSMQLQPGMLVDVAVAAGKEFDYLTTAQTRASLPSLQNTLESMLARDYALSLVMQTTRAGDSNEHLYALLLSYMHFLGEKPFSSLSVLGFVLKLFGVYGFVPALTDQGEADKKDIVAFAPSTGSLVSRTEVQVYRQRGESLVRCTAEDAEGFRSCLYGNWEEIAALAPSRTSMDRVEQMIYTFVQHHSERRVPRFGRVLQAVI